LNINSTSLLPFLSPPVKHFLDEGVRVTFSMFL
jgi:hypothetical protein